MHKAVQELHVSLSRNHRGSERIFSMRICDQCVISFCLKEDCLSRCALGMIVTLMRIYIAPTQNITYIYACTWNAYAVHALQ